MRNLGHSQTRTSQSPVSTYKGIFAVYCRDIYTLFRQQILFYQTNISNQNLSQLATYCTCKDDSQPWLNSQLHFLMWKKTVKYVSNCSHIFLVTMGNIMATVLIIWGKHSQVTTSRVSQLGFCINTLFFVLSHSLLRDFK